jgi:LuxR family maltose regulon positive regulatory protein
VLTHHAWHWTVAAQCRLLIRAGRLDEAAAKAEPATSPGETATYQQLTLARLMLARYAQNRDRESLDQVDRLLAEALERAETSGWTRDMIECLIIRCRVHDLAGDHKAAANDLSRALSLAALEGSLRLFLDEGEAIARLLQYLTPQNVPIDYLDRLRRAFDLEIESGQAPELTTPQPNDPSRVAQSPALVEQISQREHDVLNLIAIGASNREIADQLVIALPTVKKHISNILGKLNVTNRTQAIARARELGLL